MQLPKIDELGLLTVVEHSAGPSAPPRYSSSRAYRDPGAPARPGGPADISAVEYEGYEVDEEQDEGDEPGMVRAVSETSGQRGLC